MHDALTMTSESERWPQANAVFRAYKSSWVAIDVSRCFAHQSFNATGKISSVTVMIGTIPRLGIVGMMIAEESVF